MSVRLRERACVMQPMLFPLIMPDGGDHGQVHGASSVTQTIYPLPPSGHCPDDFLYCLSRERVYASPVGSKAF
jgi:hypothetical protein